MKFLYCVLASIWLPLVAATQVVKPDAASTTPSLSSYSLPANYNDPAVVNFIRTWTACAPLTAPTTTDLADQLKYGEATAYFDGLGRLLQEVVRAESPDGTKDLVSTHIYDAIGREAQQFLPVPITPAAGNEGRYKTNPFAAQRTYYEINYNDRRPYSETIFEPSPLNRPEQSFAPGNSWMGSKSTATPPVTMNERSVNSSYEINGANEVLLWNIGFNNGDIPVKGTANSGYYATGELYRNIITDEQKKRVIEYKDKQGQVILKKVEVPITTGTPSDKLSHTGWLCTYYVYDDFGLLRFVIQPKATAWLAMPANNWTFPTIAGGGDIGNELCFRYVYDSRNRMVIKKVPGASEVWMVYDKRDRPVMTQDANQRSQGKWLVTQYDELNRPKRTYLWDNIATRSSHETDAALPSVTDYPTLTGTYELLTEAYYDDYTWVSSSGSGLTATMDNAQATSWYFMTTSNTSYPYPQAIVADYGVKGMVTGTKMKILGTTGEYLYTVTFYDDKGRIVQSQSTNYSSGKDIVTTQFSFDGKPLVSGHYHNPASPGKSLIVYSRMTYDHMGRLLKTTKQIKQIDFTVTTSIVIDPSTPEVTIAENEYDDLGKLKSKKLGLIRDVATSAYTTNPLEKLDYTYNIRGWLNGINRGYANPDRYGSGAIAQSNRWFGMELNYDWGFSKSQYNGNISGTIWHSRGDDEKRAYGFDYDAANRMMKGDFTQRSSANVWDISAGVNYSMQMGDGVDPYSAYDANGNILNMRQIGYKPGSSATPSATSMQIDNLVYSYYSNTNKLQTVAEQSLGATNNKLGDFTDGNNSGDDYGYDVNGNLITDKNKSIIGTTGLDVANGGAITYNHLNLPKEIIVAGKGTITYVYDATGNKLEKKTVDNTVSPAKETHTYYEAGFVYEKVNSNPVKLLYLSHEEGRIRLIARLSVQQINRDFCPPEDPCYPILSFESFDEYEFDYFVKDHLGNIRAVLTDELQQDNYPAATLEKNKIDPNPALDVEKKYYTIDDANIVNKPSGITDYENNNGLINPNPQGNSFAISGKVYQLNGSDPNAQKGLDMVLKVMSGDHIDIFGKSYHTAGTSNPSQTPMLLSFLLDGFLSASGSIAGSATHGSSAVLGSIPSISNPLTALQQLQQGNTTNTGLPQASINWILFDEQFNIVDKSFSPVGPSGSVKSHYTDAQLQNIAVNKNGYLYVYCSNESPVNVFFDNLQVVHTRGPLLEETHYYPFGLTMAGISSKAAGKLENKKLYAANELQSKEFSDGSGLDFYDFNARTYDQQTGRFLQIDPKTDEGGQESWNPYQYCFNNPILNTDPDGKQPGMYDLFGQMYRQAGISSSTDVKDYTVKIAKEGLKPSTWIAGYAAVGQMAGGTLLAIMSEGLGVGAVARAEAKGISTTLKASTSEVGVPVASKAATAESVNLNAVVQESSAALKAAGQRPAAVIAGEDASGYISIAKSGLNATAEVAPQLKEIVKSLGGIGAKVGNNTVGACAEYNLANPMLKANPNMKRTDIKMSDALRPGTGNIVQPCPTCQKMFGLGF